jgi:shikimate kinase
MMGAGKSTVGPLVAERLGLAFVDLDERVATAAGTTIAELFASEGEAGFRAREREAVAGVAGAEAVVACGGGAVLAADNVARMRESGLVVWLGAPVPVLRRRVGSGKGRPLLAGDDPAGDVERILAARRGAYAAAAHHRVETAGRRVEEVAGEVVRLWKRYA